MQVTDVSCPDIPRCARPFPGGAAPAPTLNRPDPAGETRPAALPAAKRPQTTQIGAPRALASSRTPVRYVPAHTGNEERMTDSAGDPAGAAGGASGPLVTPVGGAIT